MRDTGIILVVLQEIPLASMEKNLFLATTAAIAATKLFIVEYSI